VYESWAADELRSVNAHLEFILREAAVRAAAGPRDLCRPQPLNRTNNLKEKSNKGVHQVVPQNGEQLFLCLLLEWVDGFLPLLFQLKMHNQVKGVTNRQVNRQI
jgi:hypothetical protein